jgi:cation diffusion facilitator CzcD-associated flavoprotein CzcO
MSDQPLDVLIVGAGISGIGCAAILSTEQPQRSWRILEMRDAIGGTWDLFRYPGIRSDSDLYTFGYDFKPWTSDNAIAGGDEILAYLNETVDEYGLRDRIDFGRRVVRADWSSDEALWAVTTENESGEHQTVRARWLFMASGYYDYEQGYRPDFPEEERFDGPIVHPQHWPEDLDTTGKRIAVIGSGATAVTLVPALAETAAHVVQVQRTPTYVLPLPRVDPVLKLLKPVLSKRRLHRVMRAKNARMQRLNLALCQRFPNAMRRLYRRANRKALPDDFPVDVHFNPPYDPWDQRLCAAPDGDFFKSLSAGTSSIVTGHIARFTERGIQMRDGSHVDADIIVTATGLNLLVAGGVDVFVDGDAVDWSEHVIFRGMMLDGVPNASLAIGYTNSSWTLKVGLLCRYLMRLLDEMDARGMAVCTPRLPSEDVPRRPILDFGAGYVKRALNRLPRQGPAAPWQMTRDYLSDRKLVLSGPVITPEMELRPAPGPPRA